MLKPKFLHPNEMKRRIKKDTITFRIDVSAKNFLQKLADEYGLTLADLISKMIDSYAKELEALVFNCIF
jgi:antitoxin component of RelBE/YafQ-DinJ toxin-antitoxin module